MERIGRCILSSAKMTLNARILLNSKGAIASLASLNQPVNCLTSIESDS